MLWLADSSPDCLNQADTFTTFEIGYVTRETAQANILKQGLLKYFLILKHARQRTNDTRNQSKTLTLTSPHAGSQQANTPIKELQMCSPGSEANHTPQILKLKPDNSPVYRICADIIRGEQCAPLLSGKLQ